MNWRQQERKKIMDKLKMQTENIADKNFEILSTWPDKKKNDSVATNFDQIFASISPDTVRKVL